MGHVKQKKSTSSSTSTPPEPLAIEVNYKENVSSHRENRYPEQLNAEELISQINCSRNISSNANEVTNSNNRNDSNNNSNNNNNTIHRANQHCNTHDESVDVEKASERRPSKQRPLYRRLFSFIRNLWIGAKFNVGKAGKQKKKITFHDIYYFRLIIRLRCGVLKSSVFYFFSFISIHCAFLKRMC